MDDLHIIPGVSELRRAICLFHQNNIVAGNNRKDKTLFYLH